MVKWMACVCVPLTNRDKKIHTQKGSKVKLPRCRLPNKKFLVAKSLYLEGHFWLSICGHLSPHCPHSSVASGRTQHCDQWRALKQYGAALTVIVLSMVLVQGPASGGGSQRLIWSPLTSCVLIPSSFLKTLLLLFLFYTVYLKEMGGELGGEMWQAF